MVKKETTQLLIGRIRLLPSQSRRAIPKLLEQIYKIALPHQPVVSLIFVRDREMKKLNEQWRGKAEPTDVLSFPAQEGTPMPGTENLLGDIVISVDTAQVQALEFGHTLSEEIAVLFVHGIHHLLGFDHEKSASEAKKQLAAEVELLRLANLNPDIALGWRTREDSNS